METIAVQIPGSLYSSLYAQHGESTTDYIVEVLNDLPGTGPAKLAVGAPSGGQAYTRPGPDTITGKVWAIADRIQAESGFADREAVIKACMDVGINVNTASTQFSYWKKSAS